MKKNSSQWDHDLAAPFPWHPLHGSAISLWLNASGALLFSLLCLSNKLLGAKSGLHRKKLTSLQSIATLTYRTTLSHKIFLFVCLQDNDVTSKTSLILIVFVKGQHNEHNQASCITAFFGVFLETNIKSHELRCPITHSCFSKSIQFMFEDHILQSERIILWLTYCRQHILQMIYGILKHFKLSFLHCLFTQGKTIPVKPLVNYLTLNFTAIFCLLVYTA